MNEVPDDRPSAVALSYLDKKQAPIVVAKGYGVAAESIMREARENGLYVHASPELIRLLMQVDLDRQIPPELYLAVAEVMAWIHGLERAEAENRIAPS
ncbi:Flagellar biosynthetic protein FlhB [Variovorax sp. PBL-H6]|uniref:EscU/YscU/HrcU family type III secretion system export apparatus switch protein n=1 Tax=Variovorax sp. PBL-H6 TaxID=434009 RepID=UPI001318B734|nr:EscU/YscU/HrcU family type III secretion system export apparatus switch protein [Variovorax sp. PBL-H6]VTU22542.1 Flagellar biosynthetic protein FlhB [Variovorax sp. PBL-H6]